MKKGGEGEPCAPDGNNAPMLSPTRCKRGGRRALLLSTSSSNVPSVTGPALLVAPAPTATLPLERAPRRGRTEKRADEARAEVDAVACGLEETASIARVEAMSGRPPPAGEGEAQREGRWPGVQDEAGFRLWCAS